MADKIFINYRRIDSIGTAGRLSDRLAQSFGQENLFMDVDSIPAGVDFVADLDSRVAQCRIFLVIIGPNWLDVRDENGERRLDSPDDFVTIEIAAALKHDIRVIPVLVDGARMPKANQLPECIKPLVRRNAIEVRNTQFGRDSEALLARVRGVLREGASAQVWRRSWTAGVGVVAVMALVGLTVYTWTKLWPMSLVPGTAVFYDPMSAGARVDWCYKNGGSCGREAAIAYCNQQNFKSVADGDGFKIDPNIGNTRALAGDQHYGRDGFKFIKCIGPLN